MKLVKAIEITTIWQSGGDITSFDDINTAIKLLIEAGKRVKSNRTGLNPDFNAFLPGETED